MDDTLRRRVLAWIDGDPDEHTRAELRALLDSTTPEDAVDLADRFDGRLAFGTAGIRGPVEAGPNRLNLAVVRQTAWGIGQHVVERHGDGALVVVGNDARPDSPRFATDLAAVLAACGLRVARFGAPVPTPIVAWWARDRSAAAAVVVTASHNPRADNGIKVYDERGIQIVPPTDAQIADAIARAPRAVDVPADPAAVEVLPDDVEAGYRACVLEAMAGRFGPTAPDRVTIVATALHGVGGAPLVRLLADAGHRVEQVAAQAEPDGTFPTLDFPNPEEPGALDLALDLAAQRGADLVLANDPDADRLAVALPRRHPAGAGGHRVLTGNELGVLLADALLATAPPGRGAPVVASSIVSSPQLSMLADVHGAEHRWTLTGFKWIWTALLDAERAGADPVLGYEEALGYAVVPAIRDKDGLSAALAVAELAAAEAARGRTLADRLDDVTRATGLWVSAQRSRRLDGEDAGDRMRAGLAALRRSSPGRIGGLDVLGVTDFLVGADGRPVWLGTQDLLAFEVEGGRVLVRPSGTEPKLKAYADVHEPSSDGPDPRARVPELESEAASLAGAALGLALG